MFKLIILVLLVADVSHAIIHEVISIAETSHWFNQADENTLVIFDVDYTLIMPENPAFHRPNWGKYQEWVIALESELTQDDWPIYSGIFMFKHAPILVESDISQFIKSLQDNRVPVIALTASHVGKAGPVCCIEDRREDELTRLGIHLETSFTDFSPILFPEFSSVRRNGALFQNGILSTNGGKNGKGAVLKAFLEAVKWKPSKLIFIDDRRDYLSSVEEMCLSSGIAFLGIHYRASEHVASSEIGEEELKRAWEEVFAEAKSYAKK